MPLTSEHGTTNRSAEPSSIEPQDAPTFAEFADVWLAHQAAEGGRSGGGLAPRSAEDLEWRLLKHLVPAFGARGIGDIRVADVDAYRLAKVSEGPLSPSSVNKTLSTLAAILDLACDYDLIERNPAVGRRRRLRVARPTRSWLDRAEHICALVDAAEALDERDVTTRRYRRPLLATLTFAGLRISEALALRWSDLDLERGTIAVRAAKTNAGVRSVNMLPVLLAELNAYQAEGMPPHAGLVFPTRSGRQLGASNVRKRVLAAAVRLANRDLARAARDPLPAGLTPHALRRTFASLLFAIGEAPPYVMAQLGHTSPQLTLSVYARQMDRRDGEPERLRALVDAGRRVTGQSSAASPGPGAPVRPSGDARDAIDSTSCAPRSPSTTICLRPRSAEDESEGRHWDR